MTVQAKPICMGSMRVGTGCGKCENCREAIDRMACAGERITTDENGFVTGIEAVERPERCQECAHSGMYREWGMKVCLCASKNEDVPLGSWCPDWKEYKAG